MKTGFGLGKGAAAEQSLKRAKQLHGMAWENKSASVLQHAMSRERGGHGLATLWEHECLTKGKDTRFEDPGERKKPQLFHFCPLLSTSSVS